MSRRLSAVAAILAIAVLVPQVVWAAVGSFSSANSTPAVSAVNSSTGKGVNAASKGYAGYFVSTATSGAYSGLFAQETSPTTGANGLYGYASSTGTGATNGVYGRSNATVGRGLYGLAASTASATNYGVYGQANGWTGRGVFGSATKTGSVQNFGVYGQAAGSGLDATGVHGLATSATGSTNGVWGRSNSSGGTGVFGSAPFGVFGVLGAGGLLGVAGVGASVGVEGLAGTTGDGTYGVLSDNDLGVMGHFVGALGEVVGVCTIAAGQASSTNCTFTTPFDGNGPAPQVFVTPVGDPGGYLYVAGVTSDGDGNWNGFTATRSATPGTEATIHWFAVGRDASIDPAAPVRAAMKRARAKAAQRFER